MKYNWVPRRYDTILPFDLYKDNVIILSWQAGNWNPVYSISFSYDYIRYPTISAYVELYLYNLTDEDFIHLNLIGIPIKKSLAINIPELTNALENKIQSFNAIDVNPWPREF